MCCRGIFHPRAVIYDELDLVAAKRIRAEIIHIPGEENPLFRLPCPAFNDVCTVYPDRPSVCRKHQCQVLADTLDESISFEQASQRVKHTKTLLDKLLPTLQQLAQDTSSQRPEELMGKILSRLPAEKDRSEFKKNNSQLLIEYGVFIKARDTQFYPGLEK